MVALWAPIALVNASPTLAAEDPDGLGQLTVRISRVAPALLEPGDDVVVAGTVSNPQRHAWTDVRVFPAMATSPFVERAAARTAIVNGPDYVGEPITTATARVELGTLRAGESRRFAMTIRTAELDLAGTDGVYPIGVQVLAATPEDSSRELVAGRANTFIPMRTARAAVPAPTTVLWPFLLPGTRDARGGYADGDRLARLIGPRGQMRNLLNLAMTTPRRGSDVVVDPSLLQVVHDMTEAPGETDAAETRRRNASSFLTDLARLADRYACATVGFDQPDILAFAASEPHDEFNELVNRATDGTLDEYDLDCMRVEWPSPHGVDRNILSALEADGVDAVFVSPWAVPGWDATRGNVLEHQTASGDLPLVVADQLDSGAAGTPTAATLRQAILSEAAFTSIAAGRDTAKTATVVMVSPRFNPGTVAGEPLAPVYTSDLTDPKNFAETVRERRTPYADDIPDKAEATPVAWRQLTVAADAAQTAQLFDSMLLEDDDRAANAQLVARLLSERWRKHTATGLRAAEHTADELNRTLASIAVDGPEALTLTSGDGQFPVTVRNETSRRVRVGLTFETTAPNVRFQAPSMVDVSAGESRTVTVDVDMHQETATTVTARLTAADGREFGAATNFNVRSSQVGAALWVAIAVSVAFVAVALVRRFARPGHRPDHATLPPEDFDD